MMIIKKLKTMRRGIAERGVIGFFRYYLFESDNVLLGQFVELTGGKVRIEKLLIDTNSAVIPTQNKSQFVQNRFERPERDSIKRFLDPSLPVIELGGSLGVVACMTNKILHDPVQHIVVEAHPEMARLLWINRAQNHCQFKIVEKAIAYNTDTVTFHQDGFSSRVESDDDGQLKVPTATLEILCEANDFDMFTLICDIEGTEIDLLAHEPELLKQRVSMIIMELHPTIVGMDKFNWSLQRLNELNFERIHQEQTVYVFKNTS